MAENTVTFAPTAPDGTQDAPVCPPIISISNPVSAVDWSVQLKSIWDEEAGLAISPVGGGRIVMACGDHAESAVALKAFTRNK